MDKSEAINKVKEYRILLKEYMHFENLYLYGSYANNTSREDSDIDVAVVVNRIDGDYFATNPLLWKLRRQIDDRIEPILIERDFDDSDFLAEVKKYGIEIT